VRAILDKVEGVADVTCDRKNKTVSFTAKDKETAHKALDALYDGGFAGTGSFGDLSFARATAATKGQTNEVTVKGVHACCKRCVGIIKGLFKDATVTVTGTGVQKDLRITGENLNVSEVLSKLEGAGFSGRAEGKK
jgi:hypothetical protein